MEFGEILQQMRQEVGLSQNGLAKAAGVDVTNLNRIERGKQGVPRAGTVVKLVRGLGLPLTDERAQGLFLAAGVRTARRSGGDAVLGSPVSARPTRNQAPILRELRLTLLHAVDLIAQLEEQVDRF